MFGMPVNKPAQFIYINELKAAVLVIFMNFAFGAVGYGAVAYNPYFREIYLFLSAVKISFNFAFVDLTAGVGMILFDVSAFYNDAYIGFIVEGRVNSRKYEIGSHFCVAVCIFVACNAWIRGEYLL